MVVEDNPIIARRFRGDALESLHRGCWVVVDGDGNVLAGAGDPEQPVFARSASKSMQALASLDLGIVERFGLGAEHVAVMVSSHNGEAEHRRVVGSMLTAAGIDESWLRCGHAAPWDDPHATKRRITHNCSGKHAGFLCGTLALGGDLGSYLVPDGALQQQVQRAVCSVASLDEDWQLAVDGCSAPTFVMPLRKLALGIARVANPDRLPADAATFASHCQAITDAVAAHPQLVAGRSPARFDTAVIEATQGRLFPKGGADGVQVIGVRGSGIGFAAKIDDGTSRALEPLALRVLAEHGHLSHVEQDALAAYHDPIIRNADGLAVGEQVLVEPVR